jgi:hypothetical protein
MRTTFCSLSVALVALLGCSPSPSPKPAAAPAPEAPDDGSPMKLVAKAAQGIGDPEIEVSNLADEPLPIDIIGPVNRHLDVPANEARTIKLPAGNYVFRMIRDGIPNDFAYSFAPDYRYSISMRLVLEVDNPKLAGKGFECFEIKQKPTHWGCSRRAELCEKGREDVPPKIATGECVHRAEMYFFRAKSKDGRPTVYFEPTVGECEALKKVYVSQNAGVETSACEARN